MLKNDNTDVVCTLLRYQHQSCQYSLSQKIWMTPLHWNPIPEQSDSGAGGTVLMMTTIFHVSVGALNCTQCSCTHVAIVSCNIFTRIWRDPKLKVYLVSMHVNQHFHSMQ